MSQSSVVQIVNKDLLLKCFKRRRAQELMESNRLARLVRSQQLLKRYQEYDVAFLWFTDEKIFTVAVHTITIFFFDRNCCQRFDVFRGRILSSSRTMHLHIVRMKQWRFCIEKHQASFLQICGLQTVQISIQLITRSGLSCSVV